MFTSFTAYFFPLKVIVWDVVLSGPSVCRHVLSKRVHVWSRCARFFCPSQFSRRHLGLKALHSLHLDYDSVLFSWRKKRSSLWSKLYRCRENRHTAGDFILDLKMGLLRDFQLPNNQPHKHCTLLGRAFVFPKLSSWSSRRSVNLKGAAKAKIDMVRL